MMVFLEPFQGLPMGTEMGLPISHRDQTCSILSSNKLSDVGASTPIHHRLHLWQRRYCMASECLFQKPKTPVRCKFGMSSDQKVERYGLVESNCHPPCAIPQDKTVLVLPWAVVTMELEVSLPKSIPLKKKVKVGQYRICTLTDAVGLIHQKVHLSSNPLTVNTKQPTLAWHKEVNGPGCRGSLGKWTCCAKSKL